MSVFHYCARVFLHQDSQYFMLHFLSITWYPKEELVVSVNMWTQHTSCFLFWGTVGNITIFSLYYAQMRKTKKHTDKKKTQKKWINNFFLFDLKTKQNKTNKHWDYVDRTDNSKIWTVEILMGNRYCKRLLVSSPKNKCSWHLNQHISGLQI